MKPVVLQVGSLPEWDETPLNAGCDVLRYFEAEDQRAFLREQGATVRAIVTRGELGADKTMIDACPQLELVSVYGVGFDAVDLDACAARGIRVTNTPDVLTEDVADLGVGMMISLLRELDGAAAWVRDGHWQSSNYRLTSRVHGKRVGVLGMGRIGQCVAKRLSGFDVQLSYCDMASHPDREEWQFVADPVALAAEVDVLFVTLAASAATRHIVGRGVIDALGEHGCLINISRASNVDEDALLDALEARALGGAALDVFEGEPHINPRFRALDNVLLLPHCASGTVETRRAMGQLLRDNVAAHFRGEPLLTPVN